MSSTTGKRPLSHILASISRILFGLAFFAFGLMGLFHPLTPPSTLAPAARAFSEALQATGYMMPLIFGTQLVVGIMLLTNRFVPLALALIAPFLVNSLAYHIYLETTGLPFAGVFCLLELHLAWSYRKTFAPMLSARNTPGAG